MGDACVIINEIRSRIAIQGVINLLNTQPGIFLLYNLHAQSLKDVQDRLEMVFGVPAAAMLSTDRYTFLKKIRFGRKTQVYRMVGQQYEVDLKERKFVEVFRLERGPTLEATKLKCLFLGMPEANADSLADADLAEIARKIKLEFVPPSLERRCEETGIPPEQYIMEAFFKGKIYSQIYEAYKKYGHQPFLELDFVLKCTSSANNLLRQLIPPGHEPNWKEIDNEWNRIFSELVKNELEQSRADAELAGKAFEEESQSQQEAQEEPKKGKIGDAARPKAKAVPQKESKKGKA
jgi:hypothetical protein